MKSKIETLVKESIDLAGNKFKGDKMVREFEEAQKEFAELVDEGLAHERGNNLLSISDVNSIPKVFFNADRAS